MKKTDYMPDVPKAFMYSAEVVDLLGAAEHEDVEIQFQRVIILLWSSTQMSEKKTLLFLGQENYLAQLCFNLIGGSTLI